LERSHSRNFETAKRPNGKLFTFDQDEDALAKRIADNGIYLINEKPVFKTVCFMGRVLMESR
jgi:hypothetical protein